MVMVPSNSSSMSSIVAMSKVVAVVAPAGSCRVMTPALLLAMKLVAPVTLTLTVRTTAGAIDGVRVNWIVPPSATFCATRPMETSGVSLSERLNEVDLAKVSIGAYPVPSCTVIEITPSTSSTLSLTVAMSNVLAAVAPAGSSRVMTPALLLAMKLIAPVTFTFTFNAMTGAIDGVRVNWIVPPSVTFCATRPMDTSGVSSSVRLNEVDLASVVTGAYPVPSCTSMDIVPLASSTLSWTVAMSKVVAVVDAAGSCRVMTPALLLAMKLVAPVTFTFTSNALTGAIDGVRVNWIVPPSVTFCATRPMETNGVSSSTMVNTLVFSASTS